jgi:hypothetical protein
MGDEEQKGGSPVKHVEQPEASNVVWKRAEAEGLPVLGVALFIYAFVEIVAKPFWRRRWKRGDIDEETKAQRVLLSTFPPALLWACALDASALLAVFGLELPANVLGFALSVAFSAMAFAGASVLIATGLRVIKPFDLIREKLYARFGVDRGAAEQGHRDATGMLNVRELHEAVEAKNKREGKA